MTLLKSIAATTSILPRTSLALVQGGEATRSYDAERDTWLTIRSDPVELWRGEGTFSALSSTAKTAMSGGVPEDEPDYVAHLEHTPEVQDALKSGAYLLNLEPGAWASGRLNVLEVIPAGPYLRLNLQEI